MHLRRQATLHARWVPVASMCAALLVVSSAQAAPPKSGDPLRPLQWGLDHVNAEAAWGVTRGAGTMSPSSTWA